nr:hypothetical protein [Brevundimonas subvibrioides]
MGAAAFLSNDGDLGVEGSRALGDSADHFQARGGEAARRRGGEADDALEVVGLKAWF